MILAALVLLAPPGWAERTELALATEVTLVLPAATPTAAFDRAFEAVRAVDYVANEWRPGSPLAEANRRAGQAVSVPPLLAGLLQRALDYAALSDGAFDPTWAALWGLWDFDRAVIPAADAVAARLPRIGWRSVRLSGGTLTTARQQVLGLGGIAKGWALDQAAAALAQLRVHHGLLTAGGQTLALGSRDGVAWRVAVEGPRGGEPLRLAVCGRPTLSVSTSADNARYFERGGVRYHHLLDPSTGYPARRALSATVLADDATAADALSTACFVLGPRGCQEKLLTQRGVLAVRVVAPDGAASQSAALPVLSPGAPPPPCR